jgi:hypothetical protein
VSRDDDHGESRLEAQELGKQLESVGIAETEVEEGEVEGGALQGLERRGPRFDRRHLASDVLETNRQRRPDVALVVDDEGP